jgi:cellulose synthase/poly-beta-1,6-N-acetylglucosamine synthase-like glycosyltransferase
MIVLEYLFIISVAIVVYTYFGYPLLLLLVKAVRTRPIDLHDQTPMVTVIIPNFNEEKRIGQKLDNTLSLDYPQDLLEIIVASDCSNDRSEEIVGEYADRGVKLIRLDQRQGKHYAQGRALEIASGEIIVFTDASILLPSDGVRKITARFADPKIGCVSSVDKILAEDGSINTEGVYIRYDMSLRQAESAICSSTGMSGSFYAVRRVLCKDWMPNLSNDFYIPLLAVMNGYRAIVDPEVIGYYKLVGSYREEFVRKVRTIVHGMQVLFHFKRILNPFRYRFYAIQVFSHKLARWLAPFFMLSALTTSLVLAVDSPLYFWMMAVQLAFYAIALAGHLIPGLISVQLIRIVYFFAVANLSILVAWFRYLSGETYELWVPSKR